MKHIPEFYELLLNQRRNLWEPLIYSWSVRSMGGLDLQLMREK